METMIIKTKIVLTVLLIWCFSISLRATSIVDFEWKTKSETNNHHFTIERSTDGITWEVVAEIAGAGTTTQEHLYTYTDYTAPEGMVYYGLRQTDYDGQGDVSKIVSVFNASEISSPSVIIYPNPTCCYIVLQSSENVYVNGLYSSNYTIIKNYSIAYDVIQVNELTAGVYYIQYQTAQGEVKTLSFIKE